jgi:anti-sigma-K factor RskA
LNIEEYISSGVLEAYAAGILSDLECKEVEDNLVQYPALRAELLAIEQSQEKFLQKVAIRPDLSVKEKLFASLDNRDAATKIIPLTTRSNNSLVWKYAVAASLSLAVVTSYLAYSYRERWITSVISLNNLIAQNQQIAQDYNVVNNRINQIEKDVQVLNDPSFKRVVMAGTANAPDAKAYVYWNEESKEVYLSLQSMRELSQENQYQLWAIIDGKPVDAGVFDGNFAGLLKMKDIGTGAGAFAVTIEPRGGKASPTLETMQVVGTVVKA